MEIRMQHPINPSNLIAEIQRLSDFEEIKQLKAKYIRYADTGQWDLWGEEVLSEDCCMHNDAGPIEGRDNIIAHTSRGMADLVAIHNLYTPEITITGPNSASAIWPVSDYITGIFNGVPTALRGHGHYHDEYVRTPQGWRLQRCQLFRQRVDSAIDPHFRS
jgi:hypothetical protein